MRILTGQGLGDSVWTLFKIQDVFKKNGRGGKLELVVGTSSTATAEKRSLTFLKRFPFLDSVDVYPIKCTNDQHGPVLHPGPPADVDGRYNYIPDGPVGPGYPVKLPGIDWVMIPNHSLERGVKLIDWLPAYAVDWNIYDTFQFTPEETKFAADFAARGPYTVLYFGPESGNTYGGHNRNCLWSPDDWKTLAKLLADNSNTRFVAIGASYDMSFWTNYMKDTWGDLPIENMIGEWSIGTTMAIIKNAKLLIGYQSGLPVSSHHMGVNTVTFWREKGNSISSSFFLSFEESMATDWCRPQYLQENRFIPVYYGRHNASVLFEEMKSRGWLLPLQSVKV